MRTNLRTITVRVTAHGPTGGIRQVNYQAAHGVTSHDLTYAAALLLQNTIDAAGITLHDALQNIRIILSRRIDPTAPDSRTPPAP